MKCKNQTRASAYTRPVTCGAEMIPAPSSLAEGMWWTCPVCGTTAGRADLVDALAGAPMGDGKITPSMVEDARRYKAAFCGSAGRLRGGVGHTDSGHDGIRDGE